MLAEQSLPQTECGCAHRKTAGHGRGRSLHGARLLQQECTRYRSAGVHLAAQSISRQKCGAAGICCPQSPPPFSDIGRSFRVLAVRFDQPAAARARKRAHKIRDGAHVWPHQPASPHCCRCHLDCARASMRRAVGHGKCCALQTIDAPLTLLHNSAAWGSSEAGAARPAAFKSEGCSLLEVGPRSSYGLEPWISAGRH